MCRSGVLLLRYGASATDVTLVEMSYHNQLDSASTALPIRVP